MKKLSTQTKYFINGLILLIIGLFSVTFLPIIIKNLPFIKTTIENYFYVQLEFFTLCSCAIFYLFSPKYLKYQFISILAGIVYYFLFIKLF